MVHDVSTLAAHWLCHVYVSDQWLIVVTVTANVHVHLTRRTLWETLKRHTLPACFFSLDFFAAYLLW